MADWIISVIIALVIVGLYLGLDDLVKTLILVPIASLVIIFPIYFAVSLVHTKIDERRAEIVTTHQKWLDNMHNNNCKRTGFLSSARHNTPIWTCPDGTAYLEH